MKRVLCLVLVLAAALCGCAAKTVGEIIDVSDMSAVATQAPEQQQAPVQGRMAVPEQVPVNPAQTLVGLVIAGAEDIYSRCAQHGFLRTAENLGYPARLYAAQSAAQAAELIGSAVEDGVKGLVVFGADEAMGQAALEAQSAGVKVVMAYTAPATTDAVLAPEYGDFASEVARIMCEEIIKTHSGGVILVTGGDTEKEIYSEFVKTVGQQYPQYKTEKFSFAAPSGAEGVTALTDKVKETIRARTDIVGVLALELGSAKLWSDCAAAVEAELAPASPTPTPKTEEQKAAASAAALANKRDYVIVALDYTIENMDLVGSGGAYALIARPFYDGTAQSMAVLDRLLRNIPTPVEVRLNAPVIRASGLSKYRSIVSETMEWFEMKTEG